MADTYTVSRILTKVRLLLDDKVSPYFVADADLITFIDDRQRELARDTLCLYSARQDPIAVVAENPWIIPPSLAIKPRYAVSRALNTELVPATTNQIADLIYESDYGNIAHSWRTATGDPQYIVTDLDSTWWRLVPIPTTNDTLDLEVYVYPEPVTDTTSCIDVPDEYAEGLYLGVLADAFSIEDADSIYDARKAAEYLARWEAFKLNAASKHQRDKRRGGRPVRYGGY